MAPGTLLRINHGSRSWKNLESVSLRVVDGAVEVDVVLGEGYSVCVRKIYVMTY